MNKEMSKIKIPLPPLEVQQQIIEELEDYQKVIDSARQVVENWKPRIKIDPEWGVLKLKDVCDINPKKPSLSKASENLTISFVPMKYLNQRCRDFDAIEKTKMKDIIKIINSERENINRISEIWGEEV